MQDGGDNFAYICSSELPSTFGLGLDDELLALLLQRIGGSAGVGPWEQRGRGKNCFILHRLLRRMGGLPAVHRSGISCGPAVQGDFCTHSEVHNFGFRTEERWGNYG